MVEVTVGEGATTRGPGRATADPGPAHGNSLIIHVITYKPSFFFNLIVCVLTEKGIAGMPDPGTEIPGHEVGIGHRTTGTTNEVVELEVAGTLICIRT